MTTERVNLRLVGKFADELRGKMEAELAGIDVHVRAQIQEGVPEVEIAGDIVERFDWAGFMPDPSQIAEYIGALISGNTETFPALTVLVDLGDLKDAGLKAEFG